LCKLPSICIPVALALTEEQSWIYGEDVKIAPSGSNDVTAGLNVEIPPPTGVPVNPLNVNNVTLVWLLTSNILEALLFSNEATVAVKVPVPPHPNFATVKSIVSDTA